MRTVAVSRLFAIIVTAAGGIAAVVLPACSPDDCWSAEAASPVVGFAIGFAQSTLNHTLPGLGDALCNNGSSGISDIAPPDDVDAFGTSSAPGPACVVAASDGPCVTCLKKSCCAEIGAAYEDKAGACAIACRASGKSAAECEKQCGHSPALDDADACAKGCASACTAEAATDTGKP
jgi:hypothetical protein